MSTQEITHLFQEDLYSFSTPVVVVLRNPWQSYTPEEQTLLQKILTSVKVDVNSIRMIAQPSIDLECLQNYSPEQVLIFGSEAGKDVEFYKQTQAQGFIVIRADDLSSLDDQKKKNLWVALRQAFGI